MYRIIRFFQNHPRRTIETGLTLEEAKSHCKDPETSSRTCAAAKGLKRTEDKGVWFDGYTEE